VTVFYIDVSHYDWGRAKGNLNWSVLKQSGVDIVFIRATYGDPLGFHPETRYFREMATAAKEAGLLVGGYHNLIHGDLSSIQRQVAWFRAELNSVQADFAMVDIEPYEALKANDLWPRIDDAELFVQEFNNQDSSRALAVYLAKWVWSSWLGKPDLRTLMQNAGGPLINANYPANEIKNYEEKYAAIGGDSGPGWTVYGGVMPEIWQYSSTSEVPGASPITDVNAYRGSLDQLTERFLRKDSTMSLIATVLWPGMKALSNSSKLGGIYANKPGYHNKRENLPASDYSVAQFAVDRQGPDDEAAAIDWTFPSAQAGDYREISKFSKRLYAARNDADDTRTKYIREFFGQIDSDSTVEGWDYSKNRAASSDKSHLWHIHLSIHRKYVNDPLAMKAILSILKGESLDTVTANTGRIVTYQHFTAKLPVLKINDSDPIGIYNGQSFVDRAQRQLQVTPDGDYGPATAAAIKEIGFGNGATINNDVWERLYAMWGASVESSETLQGTKRDVLVDYFHGRLPILKYGDDDSDNVDGSGTYYVTRLQRALGVTDDGDYGPETAAAVKKLQGGDGKTVDLSLWARLYGFRDVSVEGTTTNKSVRR
jgi:GH25 family lysozyme M1 (1,4-beta-N-acetylmuramidase)/peptidoglycan hydrolase-like protein with peptidoglycan-binding domain